MTTIRHKFYFKFCDGYSTPHFPHSITPTNPHHSSILCAELINDDKLFLPRTSSRFSPSKTSVIFPHNSLNNFRSPYSKKLVNMPAVLSKFLATPLSEEVCRSLCFRVGRNGLRSKDVRRARAQFERCVSDKRQVDNGEKCAEELRPESRGFLDTWTKVKRFSEETYF